MARVLVLETHPIQYKVPMYRRLQREHGHQVTALYASDFSAKAYTDDEFGVELAWDVDLLEGYQAFFGSRSRAGDRPDIRQLPCRRLLRTVAEVRPEVVLLSHYAGRFGRQSLSRLMGLPIPWVYWGETTDHAVQRTVAKSMARDLFLRAFYARTAAIGYVGKRSLAHYERLGVPVDRLFFAPYAVEQSSFRTTETDRQALRDPCREALEIGPDRIVLLFSGKLSPRKDPGRPILAARCLPQAVRDRITIVYLGAGELAPELERLASEAPRVDVRMIGFKNQSELSSFYHAADAAVLPSVSGETWGLVVNEALHHGVPCLSSDQVGSTPDLILPGETGSPFEAGSTESLHRAIERLVPIVGREATRTACRTHVRRYTLDATAKGLTQAIDHALG